MIRNIYLVCGAGWYEEVEIFVRQISKQWSDIVSNSILSSLFACKLRSTQWQGVFPLKLREMLKNVLMRNNHSLCDIVERNYREYLLRIYHHK